MSRACFHLGVHDHHVTKGECREIVKIVKKLITNEVKQSPDVKIYTIQLAASKELLSQHLFIEHNDHVLLSGVSLASIMDKFSILSLLNVCYTISNFHNVFRKHGYIDNILELKRKNKYDYIQENVFLGQGSFKVYFFKMSTFRPTSGVDLVRQTQLGGDLVNAWIMFDHVKRVQGWTTMACHVYDMTYYCVMTIVVCHMQFEDVDLQCFMWSSLVKVLEKHGMTNPNFKGFMVDSAQVNFNIVRRIFGAQDPTIPMLDKMHLCLFH